MTTRFKKLKWPIILLLLVVLSVFFILFMEDLPFLYVSLAWVVVLFVRALKAKEERKKLIALYTGSLFLAFFLGEVYFSGILSFRYKTIKVNSEIIYGGEVIDDDVLGYRPSPSSQWHESLSYGDTVIYSVTQTTDELSLRFMPALGETPVDTVVFFGCSFTFGAGLEDDETITHYFQQASQSTKSINLGYHGYGAHQILAILENRLEERPLGKSKPKAGIYSAIPDHVFRGTGRLTESYGPRYRFNVSGELTNQGIGPAYVPRIIETLGKSFLIRRFVYRRRSWNQEELDLYLAMVYRAKNQFEERYNVPFYCILWKSPEEMPGLYDGILEGLQKGGINVIEVKDVLPGYDKDQWEYLLPFDSHPNAKANLLIAQYLTEHIFGGAHLKTSTD